MSVSQILVRFKAWISRSAENLEIKFKPAKVKEALNLSDNGKWGFA